LPQRPWRAHLGKDAVGLEKSIVLGIGSRDLGEDVLGFGAAGLTSTWRPPPGCPRLCGIRRGDFREGTTEGASLTDVSVGSILGDSSLAMACGPDGKIHPSVTFRNYKWLPDCCRAGANSGQLCRNPLPLRSAPIVEAEPCRQNRHVIAKRQQLGLDPVIS